MKQNSLRSSLKQSPMGRFLNLENKEGILSILCLICQILLVIFYICAPEISLFYILSELVKTHY